MSNHTAGAWDAAMTAEEQVAKPPHRVAFTACIELGHLLRVAEEATQAGLDLRGTKLAIIDARAQLGIIALCLSEIETEHSGG